ncbi:MAG: hypothetical protein DMF50_12495, partial [Acidobacteria bacterium]
MWFNEQAEEAAKSYTAIFKNSKDGEARHQGVTRG